MKTTIKLILIIIGLTFSSCEDVIDVDVPTGKTRLVIEASLDWEKGTTGNEQVIKLSTSTPYFDTTTSSIVTDASVRVVNVNTNEEFIFINQNDGTYTVSNFVPIIGNTYNLEVIHNGETHTATETLIAVPDFNSITQSVEGDLFPVLEDESDEFSNGNEFHEFWEKEDNDDTNERAFEVGDTVEISLYGISERYHNYIRILIQQYDSGGNPFSTLPSQLRGNCINETNEDNFAYGFFRVTEVVKATYTFQ